MLSLLLFVANALVFALGIYLKICLNLKVDLLRLAKNHLIKFYVYFVIRACHTGLSDVTKFQFEFLKSKCKLCVLRA